MLRPMVLLLVAALLVYTSTADKPGGDRDLGSAHYHRPIFGAEYGNPVDESLKDIERESLDWAIQNEGSPFEGHFGHRNDGDQFENSGGQFGVENGDAERHGLRKVMMRRNGVEAERSGQEGFLPHRGSHNLTDGQIDVQSSLLVQQRVHIKAERHCSVAKYLHYYLDSYIITRVAAHDLQTNRSDSGYVRLLYGGVGSNSVLLKLRSKPGKSLEYFVRLWGHED